jgi:hypothetical protein
MWEEHPDYQRSQAVAVVLLVLGAILWCAGAALANHDWPLLREVLRFSAALAIALGIIAGAARLLVRVITRPSKQKRLKNES